MLRICATVTSVGLWTGCAGHSPLLRSSARSGFPVEYVVQHDESLATIAARFYGSDSLVTTHVLWHANPDIRNLGWIKAGQKLTIPALPDQSLPFSAGETIHVFSTLISDPPYGFDVVISKDGSALFPFSVKVEVIGLTPEQAAIAIERAYVPRYYRRTDLAAIRVQPVATDNTDSARCFR